MGPLNVFRLEVFYPIPINTSDQSFHYDTLIEFDIRQKGRRKIWATLTMKKLEFITQSKPQKHFETQI